MKNYTVKTEDVKNVLTLIQMDSGDVIVWDPLDFTKTANEFFKMLGMIEDGNLIKNVGYKAEFNNGDWIKTDGRSIASRNITDIHFIKYLSELLEVSKPLYLKGLNYRRCDIGIIFDKIERLQALVSKKYGYSY